MKKSKIYRLAQKAVLKTDWFSVEEKLTILKELIFKEDLALFNEEREESEGQDNG